MIETIYRTKDGKEFPTIKEAENHEGSILSKEEKSYQNFMKNPNYTMSKVLTDYSLSQMGIWGIYGEDPNCDFGGRHHEPHLKTVSGTLEQAIRHAVTLPKFWQWGAGGKIVPTKYVEVLV